VVKLPLISNHTILVKQLVRYALVGIAINSVGYVVYLLVTYLGATPKLSMTFLYTLAVVVSYLGNRKLTFAHQGNLLGSSARYLIAHGVGYLVNLTILIVFVDNLGYAHQWVQGIAIFLVAAYLFIAFKFFVFTNLNTSGMYRS